MLCSNTDFVSIGGTPSTASKIGRVEPDPPSLMPLEGRLPRRPLEGRVPPRPNPVGVEPDPPSHRHPARVDLRPWTGARHCVRSRAHKSAKNRFNLKRPDTRGQRRHNANYVTYLALPPCGKREVVGGLTSTSAGFLCGIVEK